MRRLAGAAGGGEKRFWLRLVLGLVLLGGGLPASARVSSTVQDGRAQGLLAVPAKTWATDVAAKEIEIIEHPGSYLRYHLRLIDSKGDELRDVIETRDGPVERLILRDNRPLTAEEDRVERERLRSLMSHPGDFSRHARNIAASKKIAVDLIKLMPDAMIYSYTPGQSQSANRRDPQVVLDYSPNPQFRPPTLYSQGLLGLRGRIWIDARTKELVRIEGEIFQSINWGWGVLAHIYPGGKVDLEQTEASGLRWNMTRFHEQITVKALMVKTLKVHAEGEASCFQALPGPMSYTEAIRQLLETPLPRP